MLLRPHLWCGLNARAGVGAEPGESLFTCCGSVVGHGDCWYPVLVPCKLIALSVVQVRSFDLTQNGHALCSAVNTQTIGTAGFLQMLEL